MLNLPLAVPAAEAATAIGLVSSKNSEGLDLLTARIAVVDALSADKFAVAEEEHFAALDQVIAQMASETVKMPTVSDCETLLA